MASPEIIHLAVYKKALEIFKMSRAIACNFSNNRNMLEMNLSGDYHTRVAGEIVTDSLQLPPALAALHNSPTEDLQLKMAKKIRQCAGKILQKCRKMEYAESNNKEYLQLLKNDLHQFEKLLSEWLSHLQHKYRNS